MCALLCVNAGRNQETRRFCSTKTKQAGSRIIWSRPTVCCGLSSTFLTRSHPPPSTLTTRSHTGSADGLSPGLSWAPLAYAVASWPSRYDASSPLETNKGPHSQSGFWSPDSASGSGPALTLSPSFRSRTGLDCTGLDWIGQHLTTNVIQKGFSVGVDDDLAVGRTLQNVRRNRDRTAW